MKYKILHESRGRIRIHVMTKRMTMEQADLLENYLQTVSGIHNARVYDRTGDAIIQYTIPRENLLTILQKFSYQAENVQALKELHTGRALNKKYEDKLISTVLCRAFSQLFLPAPIRIVIAALRSACYLRRGLQVLLRGKIEVSVLDATAITVSMLRGDFNTAASIMFLLHIGEMLEEWTHKKSVDDLARTMSLNVDKVWLKTGQQEVLVPINQIQLGDTIVVRTGSMIPLDGRVIDGDAMVNQASITGESVAVHKENGSYSYAGTVVEEGECIICVDKLSGSGQYDRIVRMIEESEKLKSTTESKASHLADQLVPYSLGGTILTWLLTKNITKAISILMVDFSCALKLSMPLAVLSAMRESRFHHISVKGGKYLEAVSQADTIVFDKTGTLTYASPKVAKVITFAQHDEKEMLRLAACA